MSRRAIRIMAKAPVPGAVKTRIVPPLSAEQAARLASTFLRDSILLAAAFSECDVQVVVPVRDDPSVIQGLIPPWVGIARQPRPGLAAGMENTIDTALQDGFDRVLVIGADSPTLPAEFLHQAFEELDSSGADVVLGPSEDGGYYLIGATKSVPELFHGIDWGSGRVYNQTMRRAECAGLRVATLPVWYDVDLPEQLQRLAVDLRQDGRLNATSTRLCMTEFEQQGILEVEAAGPWRVDNSTIVASSPWRDFVIDRVHTHNGGQIDYFYSRQPEAVFVVPVTAAGEVVLVRQYRHPVRDWMLEIPAGAIEPGQAAEAAAVQELREEIGGSAAELRPMSKFSPLGGSLEFKAHVYLALGVELGDMEHEDSELIHRLTIPHELAFDMARRGEIAEAQCALALLHCEAQIREWLAQIRSH